MSGPAAERPSLLSYVRAELPPDPARWREAMVVGLATATALGVATVFQVSSFAAPIFAFLAMQHATVCTWRNLVRRALIAVVAGVVLIPVGGVLVQVPWLLVPVFFLAIALLTYGIPMSRSPIEATLVAFPLIGVTFTGTYEPTNIAVATRDLISAGLIGVASATLFAQLTRGISARRRLGDALATSYARSRQRLGETMERYLADAPPAVSGEAPVFSAFGTHVQLLDLARQEGLSTPSDRLLATLTTAAERLETYVGTIDTLSRQPVARVYRKMIEPHLVALTGAISVALQRFGRAAQHVAERDDVDLDLAALGWPDLPSLVAALRARQLELRRAGELRAVDVGEGLNVNALVQQVTSLADVLQTPPWELHRLAVEEQVEHAPGWPWNLLPIDRFALRFALQVALGATIAFVVGIASHVAELSTLLWNPVLVAQSSYGATIRKAWLRLLGVLAGGVLAIATIALVFANTNDIAVWLLVVFVVATCCEHAVLARPTYWYGPLQVSVTYFFVLVGENPAVDVHAALWRAFGTFLGTAILFTVFRMIAPDYAGRQLIGRLGDLLRTTLVYLPRRSAALAPLSELIAARLAAGRYAGDLLRLIDETRVEGHGGGVDANAAVDAAGIALRVSLRVGLVARGRATTVWPQLAEPGRDLVERLHDAVRARLALALELVDARHTMALPGTHAFAAACASAAQIAARPRPELEGALADALAYLEVARTGELADWPPDALGALYAELEHFRRLAELLPRLEVALERTLLPRPAWESEAAARVELLPDPLTRP